MQSCHFSQQCALPVSCAHISAVQHEDHMSSMLPCHLLRDHLLPSPWQKQDLLWLPKELWGLKQSRTYFGTFPGEGQGASLPALLSPAALCGPPVSTVTSDALPAGRDHAQHGSQEFLNKLRDPSTSQVSRNAWSRHCAGR